MTPAEAKAISAAGASAMLDILRNVIAETARLYATPGVYGHREAVQQVARSLDFDAAETADDDLAAALDRAIAQLVGVRARLELDAAKEAAT